MRKAEQYDEEKGTNPLQEALTIGIGLKCREEHQGNSMYTYCYCTHTRGLSTFPWAWMSESLCSPYEADLPPLLPVSWDLQNPLKKNLNPSSPWEAGGLCCSACLQTHVSIISFLLSELTYRKGPGIWG